MSRHKAGYVISYHGILCHDMSYVTTIAASLTLMCVYLAAGNIAPAQMSSLSAVVSLV